MAAKNVVYIGCKLPHGIILEQPKNPKHKVEIQGLNKVSIIGAPYKVNEVDAEFWEQWVANNKEYGPFKSGAIFVAKTEPDLKAVAKELQKEKTGLEPLDPKSHGVKPDTDKDD
jgi:hypothetical protein